MKTVNTCCGSFARKKVKIIKTPLPPNPKVQGGISVIFLGSGDIKLTGAITKSVYYASDHHRHFKIFKEDAESIMKDPMIIHKP